MSKRRLLLMVGLLTVVVLLAAFAMPAIANENMMASNTPLPSDDGSDANYAQQIAENSAGPVSCWQYSDVFERWDWDCD